MPSGKPPTRDAAFTRRSQAPFSAGGSLRTVPITARQAVAADRLTELSALGELPTLGDVLAWLHAQTPPRTVAEIVTQDEYTHDVVVRWDDAIWLAFDTT